MNHFLPKLHNMPSATSHTEKRRLNYTVATLGEVETEQIV